MAENTIKNVKLKIGTENQFQSKLKELPINTLVGTTDPIQEGELDTSIINKLDKAENALPKPTNDTTGSAGQVLKKTASGSEWGDAEGGTTVVANPGGGTEDLTSLTVGDKTYTIPSGGGGGTTYSAGTHITIGSDNKINAQWPTASDSGYAGIGKTGTITEVKMNGASKGTSGVVDLGTVLTEHQSVSTIGKTGNLSDGTQDATHRLVTDTEKSTWNGKQDALSATQINAVNSGITADKVSTYDGYATQINTKYVKPSTGIPKTDLASAVQSSLDKADSAVQPSALAIKSATLDGTTLTLTI